MSRNHFLFTVLSFILLSASGAAFADVNAITPSTNDINRTNGWAHVDQLSQAPGSTSLEFIQPRAFAACFEYRTDGDISQVIGTNYNSGIFDGLYPFHCQNNNSATYTITANAYFEVRMVFGAEGDERFDWTRFDAIPPLPHLTCNFDSGTFLAPFNHPIFFKGKKTNRNLPLKFSCVDELGMEVDDVYMADQGWAAPVVEIDFLASGGGTDPGYEADLLPGGLATDGNSFIFNGDHWMLVLGLKAYTATGVYAISAVPGDANYTMDIIMQTYEKME